MIEGFSTWLANWFLKNDAIQSEDIEVQIYGITAVLCTTINCLLLLGLATLFQRIGEAAIFLAFYMVLRNFIGGWHASTPLRCTVIGTMLLCGYMLFAEVIAGQLFVNLLLTLAAILLVFLFAPCYLNKEYPQKQMVQLKRKSRRIALIMGGIILSASLLTSWKYHVIFQTYASTGMFSAVLTMLPVQFHRNAAVEPVEQIK